jgi:hypothetical protein
MRTFIWVVLPRSLYRSVDVLPASSQAPLWESQIVIFQHGSLLYVLFAVLLIETFFSCHWNELILKFAHSSYPEPFNFVHILMNCFEASADDENFVCLLCVIYFSLEWGIMSAVFFSCGLVCCRYISHCLATGSSEWHKTASSKLYYGPEPSSWTQDLPSNRDPGKESVEFNTHVLPVPQCNTKLVGSRNTMLVVGRCHVQMLAGTPANLTNVFHDFPQSLHANPGYLSRSFQLIVLLLYSASLTLLTSLLNKTNKVKWAMFLHCGMLWCVYSTCPDLMLKFQQLFQ